MRSGTALSMALLSLLLLMLAAMTTVGATATTGTNEHRRYQVAIVNFKQPEPNAGRDDQEHVLQQCLAKSSPPVEVVTLTQKMLVARQQLTGNNSAASNDNNIFLQSAVQHCLGETFPHLQQQQGNTTSAKEHYDITTTVWDLRREEEMAARARNGTTTQRQQQEQALGDFIPFNYATHYNTVEEVNARLWRLERPEVCHGYAKVFEFGRSHDGNEALLAVRISTNPYVNNPDKYEHVIVGAHHAREWISVEVTIALAEMYCALMTQNAQMATIALEDEFIVAPIVNVDGYRYTFESDETRGWRKNRHNFGTPAPGAPEAIGVDLNRNFPIEWGGEGSSGEVFAPIYRGTAPASETEVQAVMRLMELHATKVTSFISFHSYGQLLLYPYGYAVNAPTPANGYLPGLAEAMAKTMEKVPGGVRYRAMNSADLYPVSGDTKDWVHKRYRYIPSFTIEARPTGSECCAFELPTSQIAATVRECAAATFYLMKYAHYFRGIDWAQHRPAFPADFFIPSDSSLVYLAVDKNGNGITDHLEVTCDHTWNGATGSQRVAACRDQRTFPTPTSAVTGVRYVYVTRPGGPVALSEVRVYNQYGNNVAQGKTASQGSTYSTNVASLAVDGAVHYGSVGGGCAYTSPGTSRRTRWWRVDLGRSEDIVKADVHRCVPTTSLITSALEGLFLVYVDEKTKVLGYRHLNWSQPLQDSAAHVLGSEMMVASLGLRFKYTFFLDPWATYSAMKSKCAGSSFAGMAVTQTESELDEIDALVGGVADVALGGVESSSGVWKWESTGQTFFNNGVCLQSYCPDPAAFMDSWTAGATFVKLDPVWKTWIAGKSSYSGGYICLNNRTISCPRFLDCLT